ncbi:cell division protein FtsL [Massilia arenosa]|uniref:Cell division protein FtsL n=1 Tax=Zemynaea arenosa TaxID=2561931 RepID=A0A4Y9SEM0_9BURK|nr:cell division protein FtsL [Massilia arenosa]TFW18438.1 cell division protein FtsL [Massilia arenosa]
MTAKINAILCLLLVACALSLVNAQYKARHLFIELERSKSETKKLDVEWAQLQLDQSTLGKNARIEEIARTQLNMVPLTPQRTQYLTKGQP